MRDLTVVGAVLAAVLLVQGVMWAVAGTSPIGIPAGTLLLGSVVLLALAVTSRRLALVALSATGRVDDAMAASGEWMWTVDAGGTVTSSNAGSLEVLGLGPEDLLGEQVLAMIHPDERPRVAAMFDEVRAAGRGWQGWVLRMRDDTDEYRFVLSRATPVRDRRGRILGFHGSARDVTEEMQRQEIRRAMLRERNEKERRIHDVLVDRKPLRILLQPIVDTRTRRTVGYEALSRFTDGSLPPHLWFAEADEVGLGRALEVHAVRKALAVLPLLPADAYLSLNVSPSTITDPDLVSSLLDAGVPGERLVLEVTEHATIDDYGELDVGLATLRRAGIRLAVDDAGAGYASMSHILRLQPDIVKLDRSITHGIDRDPVRRSLTIALVSFSLEVRATVVAEGVETDSELLELADSGVPLAQGFYLGRPFSPHDAPVGSALAPTAERRGRV